MISFKLDELISKSKGHLSGANLQIDEVSTDSRSCKGAMFIALKGERFDGHDFVAKAVENGAVALGVNADFKGSVRADIPVVRCEDTLRLYGLCGQLVREKCPAKVVALTGSCGKTTVKEFTRSMLSNLGNTLATEGNFNNDVGVPKTLLNLTEQTEYAVIEQGASHPFDIKRTCEFVKADVALINNVGGAHIEGFGSYEGVYKGKSEILDDVLSRGGIGIVPTDSEWYERWRTDYATAFKNGRMLTFGSAPDAYVRVSDIHAAEGKLSFILQLPASGFAVGLKLLGTHNAYNAAAAACLTLAASGNENAVKRGILNCEVKDGRLKALQFDRFLLIDDAYNASYNAVIAALDTLSSQKGHRVMIFGDMGELGAEKENLHRKVGEYAQGKVDELLCVGELSALSAQAMGDRACHFAKKQDLYPYLKELVHKESYCTFLVKGSHSMHMEEVIAFLKQVGAAEI